MARKELALQSEICKSVRAQGGYALKLSHRFIVGVPDLLICMPGYPAMLIEVKDLGVVTDKFDLKVPVTPKQREELKKFNEAGDLGQTTYNRRTAVLVGLIHKGKRVLVINPYWVTKLNYLYEYQGSVWVERSTPGPTFFDIKQLLGS